MQVGILEARAVLGFKSDTDQIQIGDTGVEGEHFYKYFSPNDFSNLL